LIRGQTAPTQETTMFKWQFAVVAAGLALVGSGSLAVAGTQDQAEPVSKKPAMKKDQGKGQPTVSPKPQQKGSPQGKGQSPDHASVTPTQPSGKGKASAKAKMKLGQGQPQSGPRPVSQPQPRPQTQPQ